MFRLILALSLILGVVSTKDVLASASLRARQGVKMATEIKDSCIKSVVFKKDDQFLYIYGNLKKPCNSDFLREKVVISLLDRQGKIVVKKNAYVTYITNTNRDYRTGSFYLKVNYDPQIVSTVIQMNEQKDLS